tara:strand:+ start:4581 stop:5216 length:636 start_codon:yes stop_codon:yes gene_type:complete
MYIIDISSLKKEGEFGSKEWGEACAAAAVKILKAADLPSDFEWAFTERYTLPPDRLMKDGRTQSGYYIMVRNGEITGGDGEPEEALAIPGFHIRARWAALCNQSGAFYGADGKLKRDQDELVMRESIEIYLGREDPYGEVQPSERYFPETVRGPLMAGAEEGNGLHNIAASMQISSPEFAGFPVTEMLVPIFNDMNEEQKRSFIKLLGIDI